MKMYFNSADGMVNLNMTPTELQDLQYMLTLSFDKLLDDREFCFHYGESKGICSRRCESNLDWREQISDTLAEISDHSDPEDEWRELSDV